jgi:hypothetical protein
VSHSFDQLVANIEECNAQLKISKGHVIATPILETESDEAKQQKLEVAWLQTLDILEQRAVYIGQLSSIFNTLSQSQIDIVAQLYQSIIVHDAHTMDWAVAEQGQTRNSLRAIKNAEKVLPIYNAHKIDG